MYSHAIRLLFVLIVCGTNSILAAQEESPLDATRRIIAPCKSVWTSPPSRIPSGVSVDSPLLGNGDLAVTFAGLPERQEFYIAKNDFWKLKSQYGKAGPRPLAKLDVVVPSLQGAEYRVEMSYYDPAAEANFKKDDVGLRMRCWAAATASVLVVELSAAGKPLDVTVTLSPFEGNGSQTRKESLNGFSWVTRKFAQDVDIATEAAAAMKLIGADDAHVNLLPDQPVTIVLAASSRFQSEEYLADAQEAARGLDASSLADLRTQHAAWWADYWMKSYVDIGGGPVEQHYYRSLYVMGACSRDPRFPPGLFGSWTTTDGPAWSGDYHLNYNFQAPFYGLCCANRLAQADPEIAPFLDFMPRGRWYAERVTQTRGVLYPVGIGPLGIETTQNAKHYKRPNFEEGGLFWQQRSNAAYSVVNIAQRWYCTYDPAYARRAYPFVVAVADFWEDSLRFENGRYVIYGDAIHEGSGQDKNPVLTLGLLRNVFAVALDMSESLDSDADRRAKWRHILDHLSDYTTQQKNGKTVFRYSEEGTAWWPDNTLGIQHIYPGGAIGLDSDPELLEVARNTIDLMQRWLDGNGSNSFFPAAVRVGYDPNVILQKLAEYSEHTVPNGFQKDNCHGVENCSTVPNTINEMLCMGHGHVVRVFPVWPRNRDAGFRDIRTWGAFLVSSSLRDGRVESVRLRSERGRPCTLVNPWPGEEVRLSRNGKQAERLQGERISFRTSVGEEIVLEGGRPRP